jgi:hypothetical protein
MKKIISKLALAALLAAPLAGLLPLAAQAVSGGPVCNVPTDYTTIQAAVNIPGCITINVAAGTYPESVTIDHALILNGSNVGVSGNGARGAEATVNDISITASNVTVDGFTFATAGSQMTINGASTLSGVKIQNNIFSGYGSVGMPTHNAGNLLITKNLFKLPLASTEAMQIKADVSTLGGCTGTVVSDNVFTAATNNGGAEINFSCTDSASTGVTVSGNTDTGLAGADGPSFTAFSGVTNGISVTNNNVTGTPTSGSAVFFWGSISGTALVDSNHIINGHGSAISIHGGDSIGTDDTANSGTFTITNNVLSGNVRGINVATGAIIPNAQVVAHNNDLSGNGTAGIANDPSNTPIVDGTCNWWGAADGPSYVGPGSGSHVTTIVNASTWLTTSDLAGPCNGPLPVLVPSVTTNNATGITISDATLNGTNGPVAADGGVSFWVSTSTFSTVSPTIPAGVYSTPVLPAVVAGGAFSDPLSLVTTNGITTGGVPGNLPAITPGTTYYFAAWSLVGGTWYPGAVLNFTTTQAAPSVTTNPATLVTPTSATVNGTNGPVNADNTSFWWGTTSAGPFTAMVDPTSEFPSGWTHDAGLGAASAGGSFNEPLTGLTPGTTYYFAAWSLVGGIWYPGAVLNFTTPTPPAICPAGTAPVLVETKTVDSASSAPTPSSNPLTLGQTYLLVSSGTWQNSNLNAADTAYASVDNWVTHMQGYNIAPYSLGTNEFQLQVDNGFVNWGSYSPAHQYSYLYTGTGLVVNLGVFDGDSTASPPVANPGWYGDNSGSLSVNIYSCNPTTGSLTVEKHTIGGNGTFNFTGDNGIGSFSITTTGNFGSQTFTNLTPGTYSVTESSAKGWTMMDNECTNISVIAGEAPVCIISNTNNKLLGEIRGTKYADRDGDGKLSDGDHHRLAGWTINLYKSSAPSVIIASAVTDSHGNYHFSSLPAGTYVVSEVGQSGWIQTYPASGSYTIVLAAGKISKKDNFGNFKLGTISGIKYNDANGDGRMDNGEVGLSGWTIKLKGPGANGSTVSTVTVADGSYSFTGLKAGTYTLSEVIPVATPAWHQTQHPGTVKIQSGTNMPKANFGNTQRPANKYGGFFDFGNNYRNNGFR